MQTIAIGHLEVSRFILGTNPVSGFSHQSPQMDNRMRHYFKVEQVKRLFRDAESLGVNTIIGRADHLVMRIFMEYWDEGGTAQWIAQTCPEVGTMERGIQNAIKGGAKAAYVHGGVMDNLFAQGRLDEVPACISMIRDAGLPAGIAGHNPEVFKWAANHLDLDFYMCCYYNPSSRDTNPEHQAGAREWFLDKDRQIMADVIAGLAKPVIHYKIMAAGRNDPAEAFAFARKHMRPSDAVCVGIYDEDDPSMLRRDIELLESV